MSKPVGQLSDYEWLISPQALPWIRQAWESTADLTRQVKRLRAGLTSPRAHLVLELVESRRRASEKFAAAERLFFTRMALEQATDEKLADYKAERLAGFARVGDFCCGVGGDLMSLARRTTVVGLEKDAGVACFARANCRQSGVGEVEVRTTDARQADAREFQAVHIDPDHRGSGRRSSQLAGCEPGFDALQNLRRQCSALAIKLAPATRLPDAWSEAEVEFLGSRGECRQQLVWLGDARRHGGRRSATVVDAQSGPRTVVQSDGPAECAAEVRGYIYEPHAVVVAAALVDSLAAQLGLLRVARRVAYLTGDDFAPDDALSAFRVEDVLPLDLKRLKAHFRAANISQVEVKKRAVDIDPGKLQRQLAGPGNQRRALLLFPAAGRTVAVVTRRCR